MKILMMVRPNFYEFGGGDRVQVLKTKEALERRGHSVTIATGFVSNLRPYSVVHLFNMMLTPHAYLIYALWAKRSGKPVVLSTIYWNPSEWLEHARAEGFLPPQTSEGRANPFSGISKSNLMWLLPQFKETRHWVKLYITTRGTGRASAYVRRTLIGTVDALLPNGESEGEMVQHDFGRARKSIFIPNGVDDAFAQAKAEPFVKQYGVSDFVLHVGRVESRKNLIALVTAVKKLGLPLVLIGNDKVEPDYTEAVKKAAPANTLYIPELPHENLGSAYAAAKVHALASWFETPGLSSLEAGLAGCNVVTTDRGTTTEYFSDLAWYCDPADQKSIEKAVDEAYRAHKSSRLRKHLLEHFTWDEVAKRTEQAYELTMKPPKALV